MASTLGETNPIRYRGYYYDTETGFYYLQSRYYDPSTGRFLNADSYVSTGLGMMGYDMFAYCQNNPVVLSDQYGEFPQRQVFPVCIRFNDHPLEESLGDYVNRRIPEKVKERENKIWRVINHAIDSGAEGALGNADIGLFSGLFTAVAGKGFPPVGGFVISIGVGFVYGATKGVLEVLQEEY